MVDTFFKSIRSALISPVAGPSRRQPENAFAGQIDGLYTLVWRYSSLGHQSPIAFARKARGVRYALSRHKPASPVLQAGVSGLLMPVSSHAGLRRGIPPGICATKPVPLTDFAQSFTTARRYRYLFKKCRSAAKTGNRPILKVAIVHYWLVGMRGGENVVEEFCRLWPQADIFTHVAVPGELSETIRRHRITETFIARLPGGRRHYQKYLPLMPRALEALDLTGYDLVISSEAGPAKGVICRPDALHVCYCHSPMRYIWDQYHVYRASAGLLTRVMMPLVAHRLRVWDMTSAARVDHVIANSRFVARRIGKTWGRSAQVIYPPVDVSAFRQEARKTPEDFFLMAGEIVSYKRPDLAIEAFNRSGRRLVVIGEGADRKRLQAMAGPNVTFLGRVPFDVLKDHYARARAFIFPGIEDFGIMPLEAMASGRPVVAFAQGGAAETVVDGETGVLFTEPTAEALNAAIERLEAMLPGFDPARAEARATAFSPEVFRSALSAFVAARLAEWTSEPA